MLKLQLEHEIQQLQVENKYSAEIEELRQRLFDSEEKVIGVKQLGSRAMEGRNKETQYSTIPMYTDVH